MLREMKLGLAAYWRWIRDGGAWRKALGVGGPVVAILVLAAAVSGGGEAGSTDTGPEPVVQATVDVAGTAVAKQEATAQAQAAAAAVATARAAPKLSLISASCGRYAGSFIKCEGFVKNVSGAKLDNVVAVAVFSDESGVLVASDQALIDYNPILAGQSSPWSVLATYNPAYTKWGIEFKELLGGKISFSDDRVR